MRMFEKEIEQYESIRTEYQKKVVVKMGREQWMEYNEIQFSAHSCAIEGNSFTVDDTRILREQGMAMIPVGRSLLECTEMADHFRAFDYIRTEGTDEYLVSFFFKAAVERMEGEMAQKRRNALPMIFF